MSEKNSNLQSIKDALFKSRHQVRGVFYCQNQRELALIVINLQKDYGEQNVKFLKPTYYKNTGSYILDVDIKIPEVLLKTVFSQRFQPSSKSKEEQ